MKVKYFFGGLAIALGVIWMAGITHALITDFLPVALQNPQAWAQQVYFPSSIVSTILYLGFLAAWIFYSLNQRFRSCADAKKSIVLWLTLLGISIASNILSLVFFIQFTVVQAPANQNSIAGGTFINIPPYEYLIPLTLVNGLLLFWLPSCFLSQRTLRFIPPFSYELNSLTEKR